MTEVTSTCRQASIDATRCENTFEANKMFGNAILDARDDARDRNIWNAIQCVTDFPAGSICGFVQP